jgi:hypothetical protein
VLLIDLLQSHIKVKRKKARKIRGALEKNSRGRTSARSCKINGTQEYLKLINLYNMTNTTHEKNSLTIR